jgi:hypothetical protein
MSVGETKERQLLLRFLDEEERCPRPATKIEESSPQAPKSRDRETGEALSRADIPETETEAEFKNLWNDLRIINYSPTINFTEQQQKEFQRLNDMANLDLQPKAIAKLMLDQLLAPANLTAETLTQKVGEIINATENKPEGLDKTLQTRTIESSLKKRSIREAKKYPFSSNYYKKELQFIQFINPDHNKLHAARWVENLEKNLTSFISKIRDNKPVAWGFHKYLYLAKKAIETISPKEREFKPIEDDKSKCSGYGTTYEDGWA